VAQVRAKPSTGPPQEPAVEQPKPNEEQIESKPAIGDATEKPVKRPAEPAEKATVQPQSEKTTVQPQAEKPQQPVTQPKQRQKKSRKKKDSSQDSSQDSKPPDMPAPPTLATKKIPAEAAKTEATPPQVAPPRAVPLSGEQLRQLFAGVKEVSVSLPPRISSTKKQSKKPDPVAIVDFHLRMIVQSKFSTVAERLGLSVAKTDDAVLEVKWDCKPDGEYFVVDMSGELKCRAPDSNLYAVWDNREEIFRVKPTARVNIEDLMKDGVEEFFKPFQREYRNAIK
jgi:hypothetical protein